VRVPASRPLKELLKTDDEEFLDFLSRCLSWSPETRMTAEQGLAHPWLTKIYEVPDVTPSASEAASQQ
jgi:dual specificity tyrosine-phosphorylation-regulated kinase 2/3/4